MRAAYRIEFDEAKHVYTVDGVQVPSVTEILTPITARHYGAISKETLAYAAERGTAIHEACESIDYGFPAELPAEWAAYAEAYKLFLADYRPEWFGIEQMIYSGEGRYCGTVDRYGTVEGELAVVDIKTTTAPTRENYQSGFAQTVAYGQAVAEWTGGEKPKKGYLLYLKKDGKYRLVDRDEWSEKHHFDAEKAWELCLSLYDVTERSENGGI